MPNPMFADVRRPKAFEVFTDRHGERDKLAAFFEGLCAQPMRREKPILAFYGVGGVGKTSVKNEALRHWQESQQQNPTAVRLSFADCDVDASGFTPDHGVIEFFGEVLRPALRKAGFALPMFETFYCTWWGRNNPDIEMSRENLFSNVLGLGASSVETASPLIEGLDALGSSFKGTALALKAAAAFRHWRGKRTLAEILPHLELNELTPKQFHEYAGDVLAVDLLTELREHPDRVLCIVIDGFERIQSREIRKDLQNELQDLCQRLLLAEPSVRCGFVILGRERLRWRALYDEPNENNHWDLYIDHSLLGGLAQSDAKDFLRQVADWYRHPDRAAAEHRVGELVAEYLDAILRQAVEDPDSSAERTYYPYSLDLAVEQVIKHADAFGPHLLGHGAKDLQARFLRDLDDRLRSALHVLAVALEFDPALFKHLVLEGIIVNFPVQGLHELVAPLYVIQDATRPGTYRFHRKMLEALLADLEQQTGGTEQIAEIVGLLQVYYRKQMTDALETDPATAARAYDHAAAILIEHAQDERLGWAPFDKLTAALDKLLAGPRWKYVNLDGRIRTARCRLNLMSQEPGKTHKDSDAATDKLAWLLHIYGDDTAARVLLEEALGISEQVNGPESHTTFFRLQSLALYLQFAGDYTTSLAVSQRALSISEGLKWPSALADRPVWCLREVAELLCKMGRTADAIPLLERELAARRERAGLNNSQTIYTASNLIKALRTVGDLGRAAALADLWNCASDDIAAVTTSSSKSDPSAAATMLDDLGHLKEDAGDFAAATALFERSLGLRERMFGADGQLTARSLAYLSRGLRKLGQLDKARTLSERAHTIFLQSREPYTFEHKLAVAELDSVLRTQGDNAALMRLHETDVAFCERTYGPLGYETSRTLCNLASCYLRVGDSVAARRCWTRALHIRQRLFSPNHARIQEIKDALRLKT